MISQKTTPLVWYYLTRGAIFIGGLLRRKNSDRIKKGGMQPEASLSVLGTDFTQVMRSISIISP